MQDIMEINRSELNDITSLSTDKMKSIEDKAFSIEATDVFEHSNEGYVVRVFFTNSTNYSATDALKDYIRQVSVLKY